MSDGQKGPRRCEGNAVAVAQRACPSLLLEWVSAVRPAIPSLASRSNVLLLSLQSAGVVKIEPVVRQDSRPDPVRATALTVMREDVKDFDVRACCPLSRLA